MVRRKVLITGAGGFIGSNMVTFVKARGHWVRGIDVSFPEFRRELWSEADELVELDLKSRTSRCQQSFDDVDWVFHFAADMGGVGYFHSDADQAAARNNMAIDLNVLSTAENAGVGRLFFSSSVCSYPTTLSDPTSGEHRPLREPDWGNGFADALYGEEKRMATLLMGKTPFARVGFLDTVYGPHQEYVGQRMKFPTAITRKVIEAADRAAVAPLDPKSCEIEIWGDGTQVRHVLFVDDAMEKFWRVMQADFYKGPVNIASDQAVTVRECADFVCEHYGIAPRYVYLADRPTGVLTRRTDNSRFDRLYGVFPQAPPRTGFVRLAEWMRRMIPRPDAGEMRPLEEATRELSISMAATAPI